MSDVNVVELVVRIQGRLAEQSDAELADAIEVIAEQSRQLERLQDSVDVLRGAAIEKARET